MKLTGFAAIVFFLFSLSKALAGAPQRVAIIQSDSSPGNSYIDLVQNDDGSIQSIVYETTPPNLTFTLAQLETQPAVLWQASGKNVVSLELQQPFSPTSGGHVIVQYLNNGIYNSYKDFRILIGLQNNVITFASDPDPTDPATDGNGYKGVFNQLLMTTNYFFGQEIGISGITPSLVPAINLTSGPAPALTNPYNNVVFR